jgi:hypothetical protein
MTGEAAVAVSLVIGHNKNDVRAIGCMQRRDDAKKKEEGFH